MQLMRNSLLDVNHTNKTDIFITLCVCGNATATPPSYILSFLQRSVKLLEYILDKSVQTYSWGVLCMAVTTFKCMNEQDSALTATEVLHGPRYRLLIPTIDHAVSITIDRVTRYYSSRDVRVCYKTAIK